MVKIHVKRFSLAASLLFVLSIICIARFTTTAQVTGKLNSLSNDVALKELANYRQWMRVTETPVTVSFATGGG